MDSSATDLVAVDRHVRVCIRGGAMLRNMPLNYYTYCISVS